MSSRSARRKWRLCVLLGLVLMVFCLKLYTSYFSWPTIAELTELEKCPACFGVTICSAFMRGHIKLNGFNKFQGFINLIGSKNVLFALYDDKKVVIKKLGHTWELERLDKTLCGDLDVSVGCQVSDAVWRAKDLQSSIIHHITAPIDNHGNLQLCPSAVNLDRLLSNVFYRNGAVSTKVVHANVWTLLQLNAEPLILQILPEEEGWPVPKYYGACGRVVVEEYAGAMLSSHYSGPWLARAGLALQLLAAARQFTDGHPHFRFYLTDVSPDNVAVDLSGKIKFIDLENIIIVDKNVPAKEKPSTWNLPHMSETYDCDGCFAFSAEEICSHQVSDHNYYAICQHLLADEGLLHSIPHPITSQYPRLLDTLRRCARPLEATGRYTAAQELSTMLNNITSDSSFQFL